MFVILLVAWFMEKLILVSQSPRRRALVQLLGYPVQFAQADVDESLVTHPNPAINAMQTAQLKANAVRAMYAQQADHQRDVVLTADTIVALDEEMLGKPVDAKDATRMLQALRGRTHTVHTGFSLIDLATGAERHDVHTAIVTMRSYTDGEIVDYVASGDPLDKAGGYAIQHPLFRPVAKVDGCYLGVMGLSLCHLILTLRDWNIAVPVDLTAVASAHDQYPCSLFDKIR